MVDYDFDEAHSILYVRPKAALAAEDFKTLARAVDPHIEKTGGLAGILLEAATFPGWDSLGALAAHLRFVHDHHRHFKNIAVVTDSTMGNVAQHLAAHFVAAQIKHFPSAEKEAAKAWILAS